jgi:hypothetical protein
MKLAFLKTAFEIISQTDEDDGRKDQGRVPDATGGTVRGRCEARLDLGQIFGLKKVLERLSAGKQNRNILTT